MMAQQQVCARRPRLLLVEITSRKGFPRARHKMEKRLKFSSNQTTFPKKVYSYASVISVKQEYLDGWKTVIFYRHVYYFVKTEGGSVMGVVISTIYYPLPIPSSGREILLMIIFLCYKPIINFEKMKTLAKKHYLVITLLEQLLRKIIMTKMVKYQQTW